jgi:hypothetical protein
MRSVHYLDIRQWPALIEVGFQRRVESESREPRLTGHALNPVALKTLRRRRAEVNVHRTVSILRDVLSRPKLRFVLLRIIERVSTW